MGITRVVFVALLLSPVAAQLSTKQGVDTPLLDTLHSLVGTLRDSESVDELKDKVEAKKAAQARHEREFTKLIADGQVNTHTKLGHALRQMKGENSMLEACIGNDACMGSLFERMDKNNDGQIEPREYRDYMVDDGSDDPELKKKRKAAGKVLRTLRTADVNGDDMISPQEFAQWREELDLADDSAISYETFDTDQDGEVSKPEFSRAILKLVEQKQNHISESFKTVQNALKAGEELIGATKRHSNLADSFGKAANLNFQQRLSDVPQMNLDGALNSLRQANEKVLKINDAEKEADQFTIKVEGKDYKIEGSAKKFYRDVGHLTDLGFNVKKTMRAMVAAEGHEATARRLLCQSEEAEDVEVCDQAQPEEADEDTKGSSFAESEKQAEVTEQQQEALDLLEERDHGIGTQLDDGTVVESEIVLPEPSKDLPRFRKQKQNVMEEMVKSMTDAERKALLSQNGRKHLRQLMPKHADGFADGMESNDKEADSQKMGDKATAANHMINIVKEAAKPAIDMADLGLQMALGPKNEFVAKLPQKVDDLMTEFNTYMGF